MTICQGLKLIDKAGLPHPEWEFVKSSKDLDKFYKIKDYVGWTIRTVDIKGAEWNNLYINWLIKDKVPAQIDKFQNQQKGKTVFVVYPSWKWKKGGTILIEKNSEIIEAVEGEIVNLMRHGKIDASYYYKNKKLFQVIGEKKFLTSRERRKILLARKMNKKNIILEWGITTRGKFIFYRIEDIREAGKLLLEKYL